jgi:hypothetical protein
MRRFFYVSLTTKRQTRKINPTLLILRNAGSQTIIQQSPFQPSYAHALSAKKDFTQTDAFTASTLRTHRRQCISSLALRTINSGGIFYFIGIALKNARHFF